MRITREGMDARWPPGNGVPRVSGASPNMVPGMRQPNVRSTPSISLTTSILPEITAKRARPPPSCTANSPASRCKSAAVSARRPRSTSETVENSGIARTSSTVSMIRAGVVLCLLLPTPASLNWIFALLHLRDGPKVRFMRFKSLRVLLLRRIVGNGSGDDDVLSRLPVNRCGDILTGSELQRVECAQDFLKIATRAHRISQHQFYFFVRPDDEYRAH